MALLGTRDVYVACSVLLCWWRGERRVLGWLLWLGGALTAADGVVAGLSGAAMWQVAQHWAATAMCAVVAYSLSG